MVPWFQVVWWTNAFTLRVIKIRISSTQIFIRISEEISENILPFFKPVSLFIWNDRQVLTFSRVVHSIPKGLNMTILAQQALSFITRHETLLDFIIIWEWRVDSFRSCSFHLAEIEEHLLNLSHFYLNLRIIRNLWQGSRYCLMHFVCKEDKKLFLILWSNVLWWKEVQLINQLLVSVSDVKILQ